MDRYYATLILRLTLDREGQLILRELLDTTDALPQRFVDLPGLHQAVEAWLQQQEGGGSGYLCPAHPGGRGVASLM